TPPAESAPFSPRSVRQLAPRASIETSAHLRRAGKSRVWQGPDGGWRFPARAGHDGSHLRGCRLSGCGDRHARKFSSGSHGRPAPPELTSKDAKNAYEKGGAAMVSGRWSDAKSQFEKVASLQPEYFGAWIGMGLAQEALRKWSDADAAYQKALALQPKAADPYMRIARMGARTGNWKQAAEYSEAAMGLHPHH